MHLRGILISAPKRYYSRYTNKIQHHINAFWGKIPLVNLALTAVTVYLPKHILGVQHILCNNYVPTEEMDKIVS
jgi:hypothetical protein